LLGALERAFDGGAIRVHDLLFVTRDADTGELQAVTGHGRGEGSLVTSLVDFRLDAAERARATARALRAYERDGVRNPVGRLAEVLPPGGAIAALLVARTSVGALEEALQGCDGAILLSEPVSAAQLVLLESRIVAAAM
jgi:hypothetical protein